MNTPLHKPAESSFIVPLSAELTPKDTNIRIFVSAGFFLLYRSRFPGKQQSLGNTQFNSLVISNPREKIPATECGVSTTFPPYFSIPPGFARRGTCRESLSSGFRGSHGCFQPCGCSPGPFPAAFPSARASSPPSPGDAPAPRCTRPTARLTWKAGSGAQGVIPASFPGPGSGTGES